MHTKESTHASPSSFAIFCWLPPITLRAQTANMPKQMVSHSIRTASSS